MEIASPRSCSHRGIVMTHPEYPNLRKIFLQWLISVRLVEFNEAKAFFKSLIEGTHFLGNDENEEGSPYEKFFRLLFIRY